MRRSIDFATEDGTSLSGAIHFSEIGLPAPAIVMAHGFSGVKEQIEHYAEAFAEAGFSVLVFDHRSFGQSHGLPRREVDPSRQLADWRDAVTFALNQPEFDGSMKVGIWGSSLAGGLAIVLGATDVRVGCIVAQIPSVSGNRNGNLLFSLDERARLQKHFSYDRERRLRGELPQRIPVFSAPPDALCALPGPMSQRYIDATRLQAPTWENDVTLRSLENVLNFEPAGWLPYVAPKPLLFIVADADNCTFAQIQRDVFDQAGEPKHLVTHPGNHFDTYTTFFYQTSRAALEWFMASRNAASRDS